LKIPHWFDMKNYDCVESWNAADWANAIYMRVTMLEFFRTPERAYFLRLLTRRLKNKSKDLKHDTPETWLEIIKELHLDPRGDEREKWKFYEFKPKPVIPATLRLLTHWTEQATHDLTDEIKDYLYGMPASHVPDEVIKIGEKTIEDRNIELGLEAKYWNNSIFARINLALPKDLILKSVSKMIDESREKYQIEYMEKPPSKFDFHRWQEAKILGYFDLRKH